MSFADHFSLQADAYARYRPTYPAVVLDLVASLAKARQAVWDCATGSGQAAIALADRFERVLATDGSDVQLANATPHARVTYSLGTAEASGLEDHSVDAVAVAQAAHWFDLARFVAECRRVARPGAPVILWGYTLASVTPEIDDALASFYAAVEPHWPSGRERLDAGYHLFKWDLEEISLPAMSMTATWNVDDYLGYLTTWSSAVAFARATGEDPVLRVADELREVWGAGAREIVWPLTLRAGRVA